MDPALPTCWGHNIKKTRQQQAHLCFNQEKAFSDLHLGQFVICQPWCFLHFSIFIFKHFVHKVILKRILFSNTNFDHLYFRALLVGLAILSTFNDCKAHQHQITEFIVLGSLAILITIIFKDGSQRGKQTRIIVISWRNCVLISVIDFTGNWFNPQNKKKKLSCGSRRFQRRSPDAH